MPCIPLQDSNLFDCQEDSVLLVINYTPKAVVGKGWIEL